MGVLSRSNHRRIDIFAGSISLRLIVWQTMSRVVNLLLVIRTQVQIWCYGSGNQILSNWFYVIRWDQAGTFSGTRMERNKKKRNFCSLCSSFFLGSRATISGRYYWKWSVYIFSKLNEEVSRRVVDEIPWIPSFPQIFSRFPVLIPSTH